MTEEKLKVIEEGWKSYRRTVVPKNASKVQVRETKQAFYAGAAILFETIMILLEPGEEPTVHDLELMMRVQQELAEWGKGFDLDHLRRSIQVH